MKLEFEPKELRKIHFVEYTVGLHPTAFPPKPLTKKHFLKEENKSELSGRIRKAKLEIRDKKRNDLLKKLRK